MELGGKKSKVKTFYTLMQKGGYITEGDGFNKRPKREWHVQNLKSELDSDYSDDD